MRELTISEMELVGGADIAGALKAMADGAANGYIVGSKIGGVLGLAITGNTAGAQAGELIGGFIGAVVELYEYFTGNSTHSNEVIDVSNYNVNWDSFTSISTAEESIFLNEGIEFINNYSSNMDNII